MSYTLGNTSLYWIRPQNAFGVFPVTSSGAFVMGQTINFNETANIIDRPYKTGRAVDTVCNKIKVSSEGQVTIDAALTSQAWSFFQSYCQNKVGDGLTVDGGTQSSFTVMHINTKLPNYARYAVGCTVTNITITADPQDYAKISITMKAAQIIQTSTRPTVSGSYPTTSTCTSYIVDKTGTLTADNGDIEFDSFTITMDSQLVPDTIRYGTASKPTTNKKVKWMTTLTGQSVFQGAILQNLNNKIGDGDLSQFTAQLSDINGNGFSINMVGYISNYTVADPQAGLFITELEMQGMTDSSNTEIIQINII